MKKSVYLQVGSTKLHMPKLVGAFVLVAGILMIIASAADMFESWDNVKSINQCLNAAYSDPTLYDACKQNAYFAANILLRPGQKELTAKQVWSLLLKPISAFFLWAVVFIVGLGLYLSGRIVLPVQEISRIIKPAAPAPERRKKGR